MTYAITFGTNAALIYTLPLPFPSHEKTKLILPPRVTVNLRSHIKALKTIFYTHRHALHFVQIYRYLISTDYRFVIIATNFALFKLFIRAAINLGSLNLAAVIWYVSFVFTKRCETHEPKL